MARSVLGRSLYVIVRFQFGLGFITYMSCIINNINIKYDYNKYEKSIIIKEGYQKFLGKGKGLQKSFRK